MDELLILLCVVVGVLASLIVRQNAMLRGDINSLRDDVKKLRGEIKLDIAAAGVVITKHVTKVFDSGSEFDH